MANSGGSASGSATANVVPTPRWLSTVMRPPLSATIA